MSHTYAQNVIHVVFSTKDRRKVIPADLWCSRAYDLIWERRRRLISLGASE